MIRSLRLRLAIGASVAIGLVLLVVWYSLSSLFTGYVVGRYRAEMATLVDTVAAQVRVRNDQLVLPREPADPRLSLPAGGRYWQLSRDGGAPIRSRSLWDTVIDIGQASAPRHLGFLEVEGPDGAPVLVYQQSLTLGEGVGARRFAVAAGFSRGELDDALSAFHGQIRLMLLATALVLAGAALLQGALGLAPLARLRERAARVRSGEERDFGSAGPSEVQPLVSEINLLLAERETALAQARARASDLAHGLKTPLTVLAQLAESLPQEQRAIALEQVDLVRQRADRQLQAARMGVERMATTSIASLGNKLVSVLRPVTAERGVAWEIDVDPSISLDVDPADLAECLGNLLDNAARWAQARIRLSAEEDHGRVRIAIGDDGPGVAESDREHVMRRGAHGSAAGPASASGSGLGLAISADIAEAYGAVLSLGQSPLGGLEAALAFDARGRRHRPRDPA
ncbi:MULTISPECIES: ATP-binding protein [unclassified Ensifer]|uniref:ATP-binding protein n=1 Tax=unclassified Ensifer TaxID=2633371 RepID=UPI000812CE86|nr:MULTISPECIES: ATP-binding protein [unclassified Ensifer]OCP07476.1 histidine kinase [Ensifer sp. LC11]OCP07580.1 histidine kinase [Ensifer sp. LC14]OCP08248.1 histidine kinase [Ensifer sp. LC13]OCP31969.1 histidine kinase [Ensifer sp. LC499]